MQQIKQQISISLPTFEEEYKTNDNFNMIQLVLPGQVITNEQGFLRGHGTDIKGEKLIATVSGKIERINKLISVKPMKAKYEGEVGDVVVGRIKEVEAKRWKVEINSKQDAVLMLSSVHLPGGILRRRNAMDALNMRKLFEENDLISAEVQQFYSDRSMSLHTRSLKYGKLGKGQLVSIKPSLIKRSSSSFTDFPFGVSIILGNNGYCWIYETSIQKQENPRDFDDSLIDLSEIQPKSILTDDKQSNEEIFKLREKISRVSNSLKLLNQNDLTIFPDTILDVYNKSINMKLPSKDILLPTHTNTLLQPVLERLLK